MLARCRMAAGRAQQKLLTEAISRAGCIGVAFRTAEPGGASIATWCPKALRRSSTAVTPGAAGGLPTAPADVNDASSLASLSERAGYVPRPEMYDERLKPGFRGGSKLFLFFLCNAIPMGALLYYLREQRQQRAQMAMLSLPVEAAEIAAEALRAIRTSSGCFMLQPARAMNDGAGALNVDPHPPEATAYIAPTEPLPLLPQVERNVVTDIFEAPPTSGLGFIHFALSKSAAAGNMLAGDRRASLMYVSPTRGAYCVVSGQVSVLDDPESRRRYWKSAWGGAFLGEASSSTNNRPKVPSAAGRPTPEQDEAPAPWMHEDYLLVRLSVGEVSLRAFVDGPQRWDQRRIRRLDKASTAEGAKWECML
eukprot:TRINITY_DN92759_c0_g1_i1.p1 TRINITY_DN92759_c0_g1~~TRINITY_DN92759_c0_g1_i1.p1  ORF type:complete len:365 (+),score=66.24 TRINITY_DN92759_c0_g1_i1:53-1147(+)